MTVREKFLEDGYLILPDFNSDEACSALMAQAEKLSRGFDYKGHASIFETSEQTKTSDDYFLNSGGNISFFFEKDAFDDKGELKNDVFHSLNKIGHAMHDLDPVFNSFTRSEQHKKIGALSKGYRQRVGLAQAMIHNPSVLILDEPTTGLDPRGRQDMWGVIDELVKGGVTLLLTTQYLEEADHLADEIAVIDHGKVIARGTSDSLKKQVGGERLEIVVENENISAVKEIVAKVSGSAINVDEGLRQVSAPVTTGSKALIEAAKLLDEKGIHPLDIGLKRPSLDDVFLALTGHVAEEKKEEEISMTKGRKRGK